MSLLEKITFRILIGPIVLIIGIVFTIIWFVKDFSGGSMAMWIQPAAIGFLAIGLLLIIIERRSRNKKI